MDYKAIDFTPDRQRQQTMAMVHFVMQTIGKHIPDDGSSRKYAMHDLYEALDKAGVDVHHCGASGSGGWPPTARPDGLDRPRIADHGSEADGSDALPDAAPHHDDSAHIIVKRLTP